MQYKTEVGKSFGYNTQTKDLTIITKPSYYYLTSTIYPLEFLDNLSTSVLNVDGRSSHKDDLGVQRFNQDTTNTSFTSISGTLKVSLKVYEYSKNETDIDKVQNSVSNVTGILRLLLLTSVIKEENTKTSVANVSGVLRSALIAYNFYKQENTLSTIEAISSIYSSVQTSFESYIKGSSTTYSYPIVISNVLLTSTIQAITTNTETIDTSGYTLVFREPLKEVDSKNVVLIFGKNQSNLPQDPEVIVNSYTTSALDFENELIDKIPTTIWTKEGSANITSANKLYGNTSFETTTLGDSLYTSNTVISGGSTPFTVEYYFLYKGKNTPNSNEWDAPIFTKFDGADQGNYLNTNTYNLSFYKSILAGGSSDTENQSLVFGKTKLHPNTINKVTMTYDSSVIRIFINDKLDNVLGSNGFSTNNKELRFLSRFDDVNSTNKVSTTFGLIDNINIFDGEARVVRDYDEHSDNLSIDLTCQGEHNATKIIDNGVEKLTWNRVGNVNTSTDIKYAEFSSLWFDGGRVDSTFSPLYADDFTIELLFYKTEVNTSSNYQWGRFLQIGVSGEPGVFNIAQDSVRSNTFIVEFAANNTALNRVFSAPVDSMGVNTWTKIRITRKLGIFKLYINDKFIMENSSYLTQQISSNRIYIGSNNSGGSEYIKGWMGYFKLYKGIAIEPNNPSGKIELDFDNNLNDKYNNSTWTNTDVIFDQVNSVKGYSAYFNGSTSKIRSTENSNLNFETKNFELSLDVKLNAFTNTWNTFISSGVSGAASALANNKDSLLTRIRLSGSNYIDVYQALKLYNFYNLNLSRKYGTVIYKTNDVLVGVYNTTDPFDFNLNNQTTVGGLNYNQNENINGFIDNFKTIKDSTEYTSVEKPTVHLPLETNSNNIGLTPLTITNVGSPTYSVVDGKKCIKFENGKYLSITSNNIFNLGVSSDFYIEFDYYPTEFKNQVILCSATTVTTSNLFTITTSSDVQSIVKKIYMYINNRVLISTTNEYKINQWNNIKIFRNGTLLTIVLNGIHTSITINETINFSFNGTFIGKDNFTTNTRIQDYLSNLKMFVGTSETPETYNDKKVLNLDFKPTRKSYLFKDNNNKCIIHPVNIDQRDYQDSQYCCTFNGTNQYLELGKNDALNFGNDDFIIQIKFKINNWTVNPWPFNMLFSGLYANNVNRAYIGFASPTHTSEDIRQRLLVGTQTPNAIIIVDPTILELNTIYNYIIQRKDGYIYILKNNEETVNTTISAPLNFNSSSNTEIGRSNTNSSQEYFNGTIYSLKVLRNTTDLSLLENEEDNVYHTMTLSLTSPPTLENPIEGTYATIVGIIKYADTLPIITATINGVEISQSDITLSTRSTNNGLEYDYDLQIRVLTDSLNGTYPINIIIDDSSDVVSASTSLTVIRDYVLDLNVLDTFNTNWYQVYSNNLVTIRNINNSQMLYFTGNSALQSNNYSWKLGLDLFTIELDIILTVFPNGTSYHILSSGKSTTFYAIEITTNREIRFVNSSGVALSTTTNILNLNTKYRLAITRDSNYVLRIFLNGLIVAEGIDKNNYTFTNDTSDLNAYMYLGRNGTLINDTNVNKHFKGFLNNVYVNKGECLYSTNYTPTDYNKSIINKSLLTFTSSDIGFTSKVDNFNPNITWTNTGCSVLNNELILNSTSNRLISSENDLFNFNINNWTIDIIGTTTQITTEAVLFDNRLTSLSFNGILIRQSASDPTSITISIGTDSATTAYTYNINTGINSLKVNTQFRLKIVRSLGEIIVLFDGIKKNRTTITTESFVNSRSVCIGNSIDFNKGFNGKIKQFRIIKGKATDVFAYPITEGDILT